MTPENPRRQRSNALIDTAENAARGVGRFGYGLLSLGLGLLPKQSREHMHNAVRELSYAFASLPRDFADIAGAKVEHWAAGPAEPTPRVQHITVTDESAAIMPPAPAVTLGVAAATPPPAPTLAAVPTPPAPTPVAAATPPPAPTPVATARITIAHIEYNPPGRDLDGEYILLRNNTAEPVDMTGWKLSDGGGRHSFTFPAFRLAPGAQVKLWTRAGAANAANLYWANRGAIWNNAGDTATLKDTTGSVVASYSYQGKGKR